MVKCNRILEREVTIFLLSLQTLILTAGVAGTIPQKITFQELQGQTGNSEVMIRGFLYVTEEGVTILASEPNLKTCCVGAAHKRDSQLVVLGDLPPCPAGVVVTVRGRLYFVDGSPQLRDAVIVR